QPPTAISGASASERIAGVGRGVLLWKMARWGEDSFQTTTSGLPSPAKSPTTTALVLAPGSGMASGGRYLPAERFRWMEKPPASPPEARRSGAAAPSQSPVA